jgi:hypothetical protein
MDSWESFELNQPIIDDFCSRTLAAIPSDFGRVIHITLLRDFSSGIYCHEGLETLYSAAGVDEALHYCHEQVFQKLLEMPLERLESDLRDCFSGMEGEPDQIAARWLELEFYRMLMPFGVPEYLRDLFRANLRALLELVVNDGVMVRSAA